MTRPFLRLGAIDGVFGEKEVNATVEEVGTDYIVADATRYTVDSNTTIKDFDTLAAIQVGDFVEIGYEDRAGELVATEIRDSGN